MIHVWILVGYVMKGGHVATASLTGVPLITPVDVAQTAADCWTDAEAAARKHGPGLQLRSHHARLTVTALDALGSGVVYVCREVAVPDQP
jgi:hypothetical protein